MLLGEDRPTEPAFLMAELRAASEAFLAGTKTRPGEVYRPVRMFLGQNTVDSWRQKRYRTPFYTLDLPATRAVLVSELSKDKTSPEEEVMFLEQFGLIRSREARRRKLGKLVLNAYQLSMLENLRVKPAVDEIIYDLNVNSRRLGSKKLPETATERFIYSSERGMLYVNPEREGDDAIAIAPQTALTHLSHMTGIQAAPNRDRGTLN